MSDWHNSNISKLLPVNKLPILYNMSDFCVNVRAYKELVAEKRSDDVINKALNKIKEEENLYKIWKTLDIKEEKEELNYYGEITPLVFDNFLNSVLREELIIVPSDVKIIYDPQIEIVDKFENLEDLLKHGNSIFDSLLYLFNLGKSIKVEAKKSNIIDRNKTTYGKFLIGYVCIILVRGDPLDIKQVPNIVSTFCPNFMENYFNYLGSKTLLGKVGYEWIRKLNFDNFPETLKNRLNMSICGYRYINCIADYGVYTDNDCFNVIFNMCKALKSKGTFLDLHPKFINNQVGKLSIKMGKMCAWYIINVFTKEERIMLESLKALPSGWFMERINNQKFKNIKINMIDLKSMITALTDLTHLLKGQNTMSSVDFYSVENMELRKIDKLI